MEHITPASQFKVNGCESKGNTIPLGSTEGLFAESNEAQPCGFSKAPPSKTLFVQCPDYFRDTLAEASAQEVEVKLHGGNRQTQVVCVCSLIY